MSTQFFDRQADARRNTTWLVVMFVVSLIAIVGVVTITVVWASDAFIRVKTPGLIEQSNANAKTQLFGNVFVQSTALTHGAIAAVVTAVVICLGSVFKVFELRRGGGRGVAETLGGRRLTPDSRDFHERRVLNVVEEMAIASGTPVPPVFLLDEPNVNAFAAGYSPSDAIVGVTRGAIEQLSREELQGVIAHEFSHILNGDMRMNIRMIGILHGILLISLLGHLVLRSIWFSGGSRRSNNDGGKGNGIFVIFAIGIALVVLGSVGSLIGGLLKSAVSRQREYLADASAVQFTRNPGGIAGALKRIGAIASGGRLANPNAGMVSHMFFAQGVFEGLSGLMATHPPLPKRIRAIEPNWTGQFPQPIAATAGQAGVQPGGSHQAATGFAEMNDLPAGDAVDVDLVDQAIESIGRPTQEHRRYADRLMETADHFLIENAREAYSGRAVMFALLLCDDVEVRRVQLSKLEKCIDRPLLALVLKLSKHTDVLPDQLRLPLVDLTLPSLASMSHPQYKTFIDAFDMLINADAKISLFEWTLAQVLRRNLRPHFEPIGHQTVTHYGLQRLSDELSILLSTIARVGSGKQSQSEAAFAAATRCLQMDLPLLPPDRCNLNSLDEALRKLNRCSERLRVKIIDACGDAICSDGKVTVREGELLRGIADLLGCPMPPLIAETD